MKHCIYEAIGIAVLSMIVGCMSGMYRISTSEDGKQIDGAVPYCVVARDGDLSATDFMVDDGFAKDGVLYDESEMPVEIVDGKCDRVPDKPGVSVALALFSLGVFPAFKSEYMTQEVTVKSPIGEKTGSYRVDAKSWSGWIPLFIGYPASADEREMMPRLPNDRLEKRGREQLIKKLIGELSYKDYVSFAKTKNNERKSEIARIETISDEVDALFADAKFDEAVALIDDVSKTLAAPVAEEKTAEAPAEEAARECDKKALSEMRDRVNAARKEHDRKHVESLIASGKYEDAIEFCEDKSVLSASANNEMVRQAVKKAVEEVGDAKRLAALFGMVYANELRDDIVMKLAGMKSLDSLPKEQLVEFANTSSNDEVVLAVVDNESDRTVLISFLNEKISRKAVRRILEKVADADIVRSVIFEDGNEDNIRLFVSVFGSDDECMKMIKSYPTLLTDAVIEDLKGKISNAETTQALYEFQANRLASELAKLKGYAAVHRITSISDARLKSRMARWVLFRLKKNLGTICSDDGKADLALYPNLVALMSREDIEDEAEMILKSCEGRIHFEGFYVGMSLQEYYILKAHKGVAPKLPETNEDVHFIVSFSLDQVYTDMKRLEFSRSIRYKLFEHEDSGFMSAYLRKYVPSIRKDDDARNDSARSARGIVSAVKESLDSMSAAFATESEWDEDDREYKTVYKSMKYGTKVIFGSKSGKLVLEVLE